MIRRYLAVLLAAALPSTSAAQLRASVPTVRPVLVPPVLVPGGALGALPAASLAPATVLGAPAPSVLPSASLAAPALGPAAPLAAPEALNRAAGTSGLSAPADAPPAMQPMMGQPADDAAFAAAAQALFLGRALRPGQTLGVAYPKESARPEGALPGDDELTARVAGSPLGNAERQKVMVELFKLGGATDADIVLQDAGRGAANVIATKRGRTDRVIVVGGHFDKVSGSGGVIDNWTGATLVANLYQALHGVETDATIVFIGFAREEEGLIGASQYVRSLSREQRAKIDAMVNLDTLGVDGTFAWKNNSTPALVQRIVEVSAATGHRATAERLSGGDADSSAFRQAGIPAVTVFGASQDVIFDIIHSPSDNMAAFDFAHYKNAYLLLIEVLKSLDARPIGAEGRRRI
jgi:hypothetical protein